MGIHTFLGTVKEQYPIPHFLEVAVLSLVALNLAQSRGGVLVDAALLLTFAVAALTLETGLLVWVVIVAAWLAGMSGVSKRTVIVVSAVLAAYVWMRFWQNGVGVPTIEERSTGFLFEAIDAAAIRERFSDNLAPFYAYNVISSVLSLLFAGASLGHMGRHSGVQGRQSRGGQLHQHRRITFFHWPHRDVCDRPGSIGRTPADDVGRPTRRDIRRAAPHERGDVLRLHEG